MAFLLYAAYQAESSYVELAVEVLGDVIETIATFGDMSVVPGAAPLLVAVCEETRRQVRRELRAAARLRRWLYKQETRAKKLADQAEALLDAGENDQAIEQIGPALAIQEQLAEALPGHPATHELDAYLHGLRARILVKSGRPEAALHDATTSLHDYQRLTTYDREGFAEQLDVAHELWVAVTIAAAGR